MIRIILTDIRYLLKKQWLIFIVLVLSIACSFLVFSMMTGVINYEISAAKKASAFHTFSIDLNQHEVEHLSLTIGELTKDARLKTIILIKTSKEAPLIAGWKGKNDDRWFVLDEGEFIDAFSESDVAVVSQSLYPGVAFVAGDHQVDVYGNSVPIIGVGIIPSNAILFTRVTELYNKYYVSNDSLWHAHDNEDNGEEDSISLANESVIIPMNLFLRYGLDTDIIRLEYSISENAEVSQINEHLSSVFPTATIYKPTLPETEYSRDMVITIIRTFAIIILAYINIISLFIYWLIRQKRTHSLYMLCGARKCQIVNVIAVEWAILSVVGYGVFLIVQTLLLPLAVTMSIELVTDIRVHAAFFAILYVVSMVMMACQIKKNTKIHTEVI